MGEILRVLIAEDNAADAELIVRELRRAGFDPQWERVDTEADYRARLDPSLDLILSDFHMPQFTGSRALELLKDRELDLPLIIVSGTIGEDLAVSVMKEGASDYLLKDRLGRLGPAVRQALEQCRLRRGAKRTRLELEESEQSLRRLTTELESEKARLLAAQAVAKVGSWETDLATMNVIWSAETYRIFEAEPWGFDVTHAAFLERVHPEDRQAVHAAFRASATETVACSIEHRILFPDGRVKHVEERWQVFRDSKGDPVRAIGTCQDITERRQIDEVLRASLREKEALLKEVHHRVKNNLQVISSLLRLEAGQTDEPAARHVLKEMQGRVLSMAVLHEMIYRSGRFAAVDLAAYLRQLAVQLFRANNERPGEVTLSLDLSPIDLDLDQAIPCGLMVNELLTNSLKHGFADHRSGETRLSVKVTATRWVRIEVSDTGVGLAPDFEARRRKSLGVQLVSDLARQLGGALEIGPGNKACFGVTFPASDKARSGEIERPAAAEYR